MFPSTSHLFLDFSIWVDFTAVSRKEAHLILLQLGIFFFFFFLIEVDESETDWLTQGCLGKTLPSCAI